MSKKTLVAFLVIILVVAIFTTIFLLKNEGDTDSKKDEGKTDANQEQATTEELQNKIESAIREKLSESAS